MLRRLKPGGICLIACATLEGKEYGTKRTNPTASLTALNIDEADVDYYHNLQKKISNPSSNLKISFHATVFYEHLFKRFISNMYIKVMSQG